MFGLSGYCAKWNHLEGEKHCPSGPCGCLCLFHSSATWDPRAAGPGAPVRPQGQDNVSNTVLLSTSWATLPRQLDGRLGWESKRLWIGGQLCQLSGPSDKFWGIFHLSVDKTQERKREIFPGPHKSRHFGVVSFLGVSFSQCFSVI